MAVSSSSKQKLSRKQPEGRDGCCPQGKAKRRKCPEVHVVGGRIYDSQNGQTCHQCRQKTMDFVAACKNMKNDKLCTFKFCHKCLFNRYGEKAEEMVVVEDWNCPKCRGICNCSFCMKKRGRQPTGILVHTARATGFSSVSELLHVKGLENVGVAKILRGMDMKLTKHTVSATDCAALSPVKQDENSSIKKQKKMKGISKENQDGQKTKQGRSKILQDSNTADVNQEDVALLMEVNDRMTRSGKSKETQGKVRGKGASVKVANPNKPQIAKDGLKVVQLHQEINEIPCEKAIKKVPLISNGASRKGVKASQAVAAREQAKKLEKRDPKAFPSKKIECESEEQKVSTPQKKHDKDSTHLEIVGNTHKQQNHNMKLQSKEAIADVMMPKGSELNTVAGVGLKPEDVGHALQFLEFCAAFGKLLNLKKGEPEYVLRELITGGRARRGKVSAVNQFHIYLVTLLQEELGEESTLMESANGRTSLLQAVKDCTRSKCVLEALKLEQFGKGSNNYDSFNTSEKLVLLNFICDELLCTEKLRSWIDDQNIKYCKKLKEAKERVLVAKQKEKHLKQKMQDEIAKAVISKNGALLSISEHDAIVSKIKTEAAQAHAEMLETKAGISDENKRPEAIRTQPIILDADGCTYWRLKGHSNESNILLQDVGTWSPVGSGEKWFTYTAEQENEIKAYINSLRKKSVGLQVIAKPSRKVHGGLKVEVGTTAP